MRWFTLGGMLGSIVISIVISVRKHWAHILVPLYVVAKGCFLGGFSSYAHRNFPELPYQAIGVTIVTFFVMLLLYQFRVIVVTKKLRSVIITAAVSIMVVYLISWILSFPVRRGQCPLCGWRASFFHWPAFGEYQRPQFPNRLGLWHHG